MKNNFKHFDLRMVTPSYDSELTDIVIDLEKLRPGRKISTEIYSSLFNQLKQIFHILESLGSVRIEGNNTTLSELVEKTINGSINTSPEEQTKEYKKNLIALEFIEAYIEKGTKIDRAFISELHKIIVNDLATNLEGDKNPGEYRKMPVVISKSNHKPPPPEQVSPYADELLAFINKYAGKQKYNLLATAIAHHRFSWIHPFRNGNGRVVRLITYAMLLSMGFAVKGILNPTAIFCIYREKYYSMLSAADQGKDSGILVWCEYVLKNLNSEIFKIEKLLNTDYLLQKIIYPALEDSLSHKIITPDEFIILKNGAKLGEFKASDVNSLLNKKYPYETSRLITRLKEQKMITTKPNHSRIYNISFIENKLMRGLISNLKTEGFVPFDD